MQRLLPLLAFATVCFSQTTITTSSTREGQLLFECNFEIPCNFTQLMTTTQGMSAYSKPPVEPVTDVSSIKKTSNGAPCKLPYNSTQNLTMYFCTETKQVYSCPTTLGTQGICTRGRFGYIFVGPSTQEFRRNSIRVPRGLAGPQCLRYFQYMTANRNGQSIEVGIQSPEINQTIDRTTEKPYNGWISRNVSFFSPVANYALSFVFNRPVADAASFYFAIDEITINEGYCAGQPTPTTRTTTTSTTRLTTTTTTTSTLSVVSSSSSTPTTTIVEQTTDDSATTTDSTSSPTATITSVQSTATISTTPMTSTAVTMTSQSTPSTTTTTSETTTSLTAQTTAMSSITTTTTVTSTTTTTMSSTLTTTTTATIISTDSATSSTTVSATASKVTLTATLKQDEPANHTMLIVVLSITLPIIAALAGGILYWRKRALASRRLLKSTLRGANGTGGGASTAYELDDFAAC